MKKQLSIMALALSFSLFAELDSMRNRAPEISELKDNGFVGEQPDGFLGIVKSGGKTDSLVDAENRDRKEEYSKRAKTQGQTLEVFSSVIGEAKIRNEKPGRYIRNKSGEWMKK